MTEQNYLDPAQRIAANTLNSVAAVSWQLEVAQNQIRALQAQVLELQTRIQVLEHPPLNP